MVVGGLTTQPGKGSDAVQEQLEDRVTALEQEVKILKNEVQETLLEIHERILVHYYPSLRTQQATGDAPTVAQPGDPRRDQGQELEAAPQVAKAGPDPDKPGVREVFLDDIRAVEREKPATGSGESPSRPEAGEVRKRDQATALGGWVDRTAERIGVDRTAQLIRACTDRGILEPSVSKPLLRLTRLISETGAPKQVELNDILDVITDMNELLGRDGDLDEVSSVIEMLVD